MKFIIGLGNPGLEYRSTRHNVGFNVVKLLAKEGGIKLNKKLNFSLIGRGKIKGEDVTLVLPQTYMNLSGNAVGELFDKEIKSIADMVVVCDDINLELGKIRLKTKGSPGGHKGLESIMHTIGLEDFPRLRVGIATEVHKGDITNYVLSPFKRKEMRNVSHAITLAKEAAVCMIEKGIDIAMNRYNKRKAGTS